jgi:hypothetical protein
MGERGPLGFAPGGEVKVQRSPLYMQGPIKFKDHLYLHMYEGANLTPSRQSSFHGHFHKLHKFLYQEVPVSQ